jgi:hypothetical protein
MTQCDKCGAESKLEFQVGDKVDANRYGSVCIGGVIVIVDNALTCYPYKIVGNWNGIPNSSAWCKVDQIHRHPLEKGSLAWAKQRAKEGKIVMTGGNKYRYNDNQWESFDRPNNKWLPYKEISNPEGWHLYDAPAEGTGEWAVQKGLEGCCLRHDTMIEGKFIKYIAGKWMWQNGEACLPPINSWWNSIRGERRSKDVVWSIHEELSLETKVRRCLDVLRLQVRPLNQDAEQIIALVRDNDRKSFLNLEEKLQSAEMGLSTVSAQLEASDRKIKELERQTQDQYNEIIKLSTEAVKKNDELDYWRRKMDDLRVKLVQARNY